MNLKSKSIEPLWHLKILRSLLTSACVVVALLGSA